MRVANAWTHSTGAIVSSPVVRASGSSPGERSRCVGAYRVPMPAPPAEPPRRSTRRDQRAGQRREWGALDTPHGFERCVRATLRELYGYVALLCGRDRKESERIVGDVYRSLFRAAGAGHVESVTLGALRSAARRTWIEEHMLELAATDEVSRAPVSTIAELSPLERAVLVLHHVNGMSDDRAAVELGRSDREIKALGAHAVRRLRGTDDTSGAWLRAYLGPSVSPSAGLVDRIVEQLGDQDELDAVVAPEPDDTDDDTGDDAGHEAGDEAGDDESTPVEADDTSDTSTDSLSDDTAADTVSEHAEGPETTELPVVERPTIEVPTIVAAPVDPGLDLVADPLRDGSSDDEPDAPGRPRWALVVAIVLLAGLVVALVWLALRGDPDDTVESTPGVATTEPGATQPDTIAPASETTVPELAATSTIATGPVELGFDPACTDRTGGEPAAVTWADSFGPLATEAALTVTLPESVDVTADPDRAAPRPATILRPDGLVVALSPADGHGAAQTIVARVGLDGTVAWVRCFDDLVRVGTAPDSGVDLAARPTSDDGAWTALSLTDGSDGDPLDPVQSAVLDAPAAPDGGTDGPTLGFSYSSDLGRSVLAGLDDGRVLWTAPEVVLPNGDAFRATTVDDTVLAQSCVEAADGLDCAAGELRGYDLPTGDLLWSRPGSFEVPATGDGLALVGGADGWELIEVRTGDGLDGQRWDPATFDVGDDPDAGFVTRDGGALVVASPGTVSVWLPETDDSAATTVAIP